MKWRHDPFELWEYALIFKSQRPRSSIARQNVRCLFVIVHRSELKKRTWFAQDHAENQRPSRVSGKGDGVMGFREANLHIWNDCFAYPLSFLLSHWLFSISNLLHPFLRIFLHKWPISGVLQPKFLEVWGYRHKDGAGAVRLISIMVRHQTRSWEGQPHKQKNDTSPYDSGASGSAGQESPEESQGGLSSTGPEENETAVCFPQQAVDNHQCPVGQCGVETLKHCVEQ